MTHAAAAHFPTFDATERVAALEAQVARLERRLAREREACKEAEAIAESGMRRLYEQQQRLEVIHALTVEAGAADSLEGFLPAVLEKLCHYADWPLGHAWTFSSEGTLRPTGHWHGMNEGYALLRAVAALDPSLNGEEAQPPCPLRDCLERREPVVTETAAVPRLSVAHGAGLVRAITVPLISADGQALGVLEFYATTPGVAESALSLARVASLSVAQVAQRAQARRSLAQSEARYRSIFRQAHDAVYIVHGTSGAFVDANHAYLDLVGYTLDELRARTIFDVAVKQEDELRTLAAEARQLRHMVLGERQHRHRDGHLVELEVSISHVASEEEDLFVAVGRDIAVRKRYELGLIEARDRAEAMARLKDAFLRNMSHEFRTPLAGILGCAQVLQLEIQPEQREFVDMIVQSGERLLNTVQGMLDLSRLEHDTEGLVLRPSDLRAIARGAAMRHMPAARQQGLAFHLQLPRDACPARTDAHVLGQTLDRLLDNALRFTSTGSITLSVEVRQADVCIAVADTGIGIGEAFLPRAFEPFAQEHDDNDRQYEGCGVGLALARRSVEILEGRIAVESAPGQGSRFTIYLPRP